MDNATVQTVEKCVLYVKFLLQLCRMFTVLTTQLPAPQNFAVLYSENQLSYETAT